MRELKLTHSVRAATSNRGKRAGGRVQKTGLLGAGMAMLLTGCINVSAPEEPIVIELNINIRQEVIYRLADDAANTIDENADIF
ncbi:YnbE family lipoprotein [uncultured Erythrobacter sp.]|uniref:YnbE family lipoprotein n=1 Tax=uncultured Erythrobacter sp. TaxID=263913 RepID=UPI002607928C|nr:YnbE family lipoprotein [uncultured Erythrobacter sp.]